MKQIAIASILLFTLEISIAGFQYPQDRVPIEVVGVEGKRLDEIRVPEVDFHDIPAVDAFRRILKMVNDGSKEGSDPFELAFLLPTIEGLSRPITLKLTDVNAILALQYITALTNNHFSVCETVIMVFPEPPGAFETKAEQDADVQAPAAVK